MGLKEEFSARQMGKLLRLTRRSPPRLAGGLPCCQGVAVKSGGYNSVGHHRQVGGVQVNDVNDSAGIMLSLTGIVDILFFCVGQVDGEKIYGFRFLTVTARSDF